MIKEKYSITDKLGFRISACHRLLSQHSDKVTVEGGALILLFLSMHGN